MPDKANSNTRSIMDLVWKGLSIVAIPALVWVWNLSTEVKIQQRDIGVLQIQAAKSQDHAVELAKLNTNLDNLKGSLNEIKQILRNSD